ncbi:hypothetical protein G6F68_013633 [Rhizopus microsporus]|nr:hypothetical protein G6F68_013633 [Rhizopus microsporus]
MQGSADVGRQHAGQVMACRIGRFPGQAPVDPQQCHRSRTDADCDQPGQRVQGAMQKSTRLQCGAPSR